MKIVFSGGTCLSKAYNKIQRFSEDIDFRVHTERPFARAEKKTVCNYILETLGNKEQLNSAKHGVRKEQVDKKHHNLFDAYDSNHDGTLEENELQGVFTGLTKFSGTDKTLDVAENKQVSSLFADKVNIKDADFMGFVKSVSDASSSIISSSTTKSDDGGKVIKTTYQDGLTETIYYYPNGDFKLKVVELDKDVTTNTYIYNGKKYSEEELDKIIKKAYDKQQNTSGKENVFLQSYNDFKNKYIADNSIIITTNKKRIQRKDTELSERAKAEAEIRDFVISHYVQTHKDCQSALDTMGILDDIGAAINAGAGELWNSCKNIYNKHFGDGTETDYQNFYELVKNFKPNYDKALAADGRLEAMKEHPADYFTGEAAKINTEKGLKFQQTTEQYQNAQILAQRISILDKALEKLEQSQLNNTLARQGAGVAVDVSALPDARKLLLEYFNNDEDSVKMLLYGEEGVLNEERALEIINDLKVETENLNRSVLGGRTFDQVKNDYQSQYKQMYGTDFVPDELTEKVMDAKATGGMVKLGIITAISVLITKSPIMAEISAAAGGVEVTGAAANMIRTLASKYGTSAVQQGIKFAVTSGTLATDVGLTLLNQVTSERGVDGKELLESAKGSAKYIYFGAYIGSPLAQAVSKQLGKIGATAKMFDGGVKSANGAIQTTSITGDKLVQNLMKGGNKVLTKGGAFLTDVAAFSALEVATEGMDPLTAGKEQTEMLGKLKIMNHFIEYMLGGKVHAGMSKAQMDATIERSGIKNWQIKEIKAPNKTVYEVEVGEGLPPMRFEDKNQLTTAMMEKVAASYTEKGDKISAPKGALTSEAEAQWLEKAKTTNPAENAEKRILSEVAKDMTDGGMRLNTPERLDAELDYAERNPKSPVENLETLSLVINGKLGATLKSQYARAGKVFSELLTKNADKISEIEQKYANDKQKLAEEFTHILADELGVSGIEPKIEIVKTKDENADGYFDWTKGKLLISEKITNPKDIETIIAHEFVHVMQFKDIVAARGQDGVREIIMKNNDGKYIQTKTKEFLEDNGLNYDLETPEDQAMYMEAVANQIAENILEANAGLRDFAQKHPLEKGSLNEYLARIYKSENENMATFETEAYYKQVIENEAYYLGNGKLGT